MPAEAVTRAKSAAAAKKAAAKSATRTRLPKAAADSFTSSKTGAASQSFLSRLSGMIPKSVSAKFSKGMEWLNKIPGFKGTSNLNKGLLLIEPIVGAFVAVKESAKGFKDTEGGFFSKVINGVKSGIKSFGKSIGVFAASLAASVWLPLMLSNPVGWAGIGLGIVGGIAGSFASRMVLDKMIDTHGHINKDQVMPGYDPNKLPSSVDDAMQYIDYSMAQAKQTGNNDILNPDFFKYPR